jgi:hypothetical protein
MILRERKSVQEPTIRRIGTDFVAIAATLDENYSQALDLLACSNTPNERIKAIAEIRRHVHLAPKRGIENSDCA